MIDLKLSQELKWQLALIPLSELLEDREAAYRDLGYCKLVLVQSPDHVLSNGMTVEYRKQGNEQDIAVIEWELNRRNVQIVVVETEGETNEES